MATYRIELPDGSKYRIEGPDGLSDDQVWASVQQQISANPPAPPDDGFFANIKGGFAGQQAEMAQMGADLGIRSPESAQADVEALKKYQQRTVKPVEGSWTDSPWAHLKAFAGQQLPGLAGIAGMGMAAGPVGIAGLIGAQSMAGNLARQHETGTPLGQGDLGAAAAAAVPETAVQMVAGRFTPALRQLFGVSNEVAANLATQTARKAMADYALHVGEGATAQGAAMAATEALTRLQAGQDTTGPEAMQAYGQTAGEGALLGGLMGGPGRFYERTQIQDRFNANQQLKAAQDAQAAKAAKAAQDAQNAQQQADYQKTSGYLGDLQNRWDAINKQIDDLGLQTKTLDPTSPTYAQERSALQSQIKTIKTGDEYKALRQEVGSNWGRIQQQNRIAERMQGQTDPLAGSVDPTAIETPGAQPELQDTVNQLNANPQARADVLAGRVQVPNHQNVVDVLNMQDDHAQQARIQALRDEQNRAIQQGRVAPLMGRPEDPLAGRGYQEVPDVTGYQDTTAPMSNGQEARAATPDVSQLEPAERPPEQAPMFAEQESIPTSERNAPYEQALQGSTEGIANVPVAEDIKAVGPEGVDAARARLDGLQQDLKTQQPMSGLTAVERQVATNESAPARAARPLLEQIGNEGTPLEREMARARDTQEQAVQQMLGSLSDLNPKKSSKASLRDADGNPVDEAATYGPGEQSAEAKASFEEARANYIKAALAEVAAARRGEGRTFSTDEATALASNLRDRMYQPGMSRAPSTMRTLGSDLRGAINEVLDKRPDTQQQVDKPLLRQQFQTSEAAKVAKQSGETTPLLTQQQRLMSEYVGGMVDKALQKLPEAQYKKLRNPLNERTVGMQLTDRGGVRDTLQQVKDAIDKDHVSTDMLGAARTLAYRVLNGREPDPVDLRAVHDSLAALDKARADEGNAPSPQRQLPGIPAEVGHVRQNAENFAKSPAVVKGRDIYARAKAARDKAVAAVESIKNYMRQKEAAYIAKRDAARKAIGDKQNALNAVDDRLSDLQNRLTDPEWFNTVNPRLDKLGKTEHLRPEDVKDLHLPQSRIDELNVHVDRYNKLVEDTQAARREADSTRNAKDAPLKENIDALKKQREGLLKDIIDLRAQQDAHPGRNARLEQEERGTEAAHMRAVAIHRANLERARAHALDQWKAATEPAQRASVRWAMNKVLAELHENMKPLHETVRMMDEARAEYQQRLQRFEFALRSGAKDLEKYSDLVAEAKQHFDSTQADVKRLQSESSALHDEMLRMMRMGEPDVESARARLAASNDVLVKYEEQRLHELQAQHEGERTAKPAEAPINEQRARLKRAQDKAEADRVAAKKERDEYQARVTRGLDLDGLRREAGYEIDRETHVEQVPGLTTQIGERLTPEERASRETVSAGWDGTRAVEDYEKHAKNAKPETADNRAAPLDVDARARAAAPVLEKLAEKGMTPRAVGPVSREGTVSRSSGLPGAKPMEAGKHLDQKRGTKQKPDYRVTESSEESQRRETQLANEAAAAHRGESKRAGLETELAKVQGEVAQSEARLNNKLSKDFWTKNDKYKAEEQKHLENVNRLMELERELQPYREADALFAERSAKDKVRQQREAAAERSKLRAAMREAPRGDRAMREAELDDENLSDAADLFGRASEHFGDDDALQHADSHSAPHNPELLAPAEKSGKLGDVLDHIAKNAADAGQRKLAEKLQPLTTDTTLSEGKLPGDQVHGEFSQDKNHVTIQDASEHVILHEAVHAATAHNIQRALNVALDTRGPKTAEDARLLSALKEMNAIELEASKAAITTKVTKAFPGEGDLYGLKNTHEFVAELHTNPKFQEFLRSVGGAKNLWQRTVNAVRKLLGLDPAYMNALDRAMRVSDQFFSKRGADAPKGEVLQKSGGFPSAVVGHEPNWIEKLRTNAFGLGFRTQFVDAYAAAELGMKKGVEKGKLDAARAFVGNYFMRMSGQTTQIAGQFLNHGPVGIVRDEKDLPMYKSTEGANMLNVAKSAREAGKAAGWSDAETEHALTMMAIGQRAEALTDGWKRVKSDNPQEAKAEYDAVMAKVNANPLAKQHMTEALAEYKRYNNGMMDFLGHTGVLSKEEVARLKKQPYIPFYRIVDGDVKLMAENEHGVRIGNIKDNPDLQQMMGDSNKILPIFTSAVQNTFMLSRMGLRNKATMETAGALHDAGFVGKMGKGMGPSGGLTNDTVHYKVDGMPHFASINSDQFGIPAKMIVMGMEGIKTVMPGWIKAMAMPANFLRSMVTRSPAYIVRQLIRDPINTVIIGAVDAVPVANAMKHMMRTMAGKSDEEHALMAAGAVSSNIFHGDARDMTRFMQSIASGQGGIRKVLDKLDAMALQADTASRASVYEDSRKKGFSEAEAVFRAMEIQNFGRRGLSPTMQHLSALIPFFNAQVQGLDVLYRTFRNRMPFAEQLDLRRKLWTRSAMLMGTSLAYAGLMQNDPDYKKMRPAERYQSFLIKTPFFDDYLRIPIPFEIGFMFKALPEAVFDTMSSDTTAKEALQGIGSVSMQGILPPLSLPAAISPIVQGMNNVNSFGQPIESRREQQVDARFRSRDSTSEAAKAIGQYTGELGISPLMLEHLVRGYTGSLGIAAMRMLDPVLDDGNPKPSKGAADAPAIGGLFQRKEGRYMLDRAYDRMNEIVEAQKTYKDFINHGKRAEAMQYAQDKSQELAMAEIAGAYRQQQSDLMKKEALVRSSRDLTQAQKDAALASIRAAQNVRARAFYEGTAHR